jgi:hypothetical protein
LVVVASAADGSARGPEHREDDADDEHDDADRPEDCELGTRTATMRSKTPSPIIRSDDLLAISDGCLGASVRAL